MRSASVLCIASIALAAAQPAWAGDATDTSTNTPLTTDIRALEDPGIDWPTLVLQLPQHLIELVFVPLLPVTLAFERWHLAERIFDLLTNDAKTLAFLPIVDPLNGSGIGVGATVVYNEPFGSADRLIVVGLIRENRDRNISVSYGRRFPSLSGRSLSLGAGYSSDHDQRFYGIGPGTSKTDERLLRVDGVDATFSLQLLAPARVPEYSAGVGVAYRRRRVGVGNGALAPGLAPNDVVAVPAGFGRTLDYPEITLETEYDSRDSFGRTTEGVVARLAATATTDINDASTGGLRIDGTLAVFLPLLPVYRTLFLSVNAAGTIPLSGGHDVPIHTLVRLGGGNQLRGYPSDRFLGRVGWWATAEWRYRFYEYTDSTMGLSAVLFADVGQVGLEPEELWKGPFPYSFGVSLRAEQNLFLLGRIQFAISPDGFRFSVGLGELL